MVRRTKTWEELSPTYRARLERNGVTRERYTAGVSLQAARGHGSTPERPQDAKKQPGMYREYRERAPERERRVRAGKPIRVVSTDGVVTLVGLTRKQRRRVAEHWNAVSEYLKAGDDSDLSAFEGKKVRGTDPESGEKKDVWFETRTDALEWWSLVDEVRYESIYEGTV